MAALRDLTPFSLADFDTAPFRFAASKVVRATPEAVFAELGDPSLWFAMLHRSVWKSAATSGVGALREVDVLGFGAFRERMLVWDLPSAEAGGRVAFTMIGTTSPLVDQMAEDMVIHRAPNGVRFEWRVAATPSKVGKVVQPALRGILRTLFLRSAYNLGRRVAWSATHAA